MLLLLDEAQKIEEQDMKFKAALAGVDLGRESAKTDKNPQSPVVDKGPNVPLFGNPKAYEELTPEQRQAKTDQMMAHHKNWVGEGKLGG